MLRVVCDKQSNIADSVMSEPVLPECRMGGRIFKEHFIRHGQKTSIRRSGARLLMQVHWTDLNVLPSGVVPLIAI